MVRTKLPSPQGLPHGATATRRLRQENDKYIIATSSNIITPVFSRTANFNTGVRRTPNPTLSANRSTHASDACPQEDSHRPSGSSLPSQQSHTPSPTLEDGNRKGICPRLAHSNVPSELGVTDGARKGEGRHKHVFDAVVVTHTFDRGGGYPFWVWKGEGAF